APGVAYPHGRYSPGGSALPCSPQWRQTGRSAVKPRQTGRSAATTGRGPTSLAQVLQQLDHRQEQRDDDAADDAAEEHDHQRLEQADEALDHHVDFFLVHVGDLVQHRVQVARLLADVDHVDDHVVHEPALLERLGDGVALADGLVDALVHAFVDGIG